MFNTSPLLIPHTQQLEAGAPVHPSHTRSTPFEPTVLQHCSSRRNPSGKLLERNRRPCEAIYERWFVAMLLAVLQDVLQSKHSHRHRPPHTTKAA